MGKLFEKIQRLVSDGRYIVGHHAAERLEERGTLEWQIVDGLEGGVLLLERTRAKPHPKIEVRQVLADGTPVKAVWSYLTLLDAAKLVTVHFLED